MTKRTTLAALAAALLLTSPAGAASTFARDAGGDGPLAVAPASDGSAVYVGGFDCGSIKRFTLALRTFSAVLGCPTVAGLVSMVQGLDGKLYFTLKDDKVGRINPDGTQLQTIAAGGNGPMDITIGPDGKIWFTLNGPPGKVGRVDTATFTLVENPVSVPGNVQGPRGIITAPDGNLYVLGGEADRIWKVVASDPPQITEVTNAGSDSLDGPSFGEVGPDGRLWFGLYEGSAVRTYNPVAGGGQVIPLSSPAFDVSFGEDGKAYATLPTEGKLAQIDRGIGGDAGAVAITPLPLPGAVSGDRASIAAGPSGNLFATNPGANILFEIVPDVPPRTVTESPSAVTWNSSTVAASVNPRASATSVRILYGTSPSFGQSTPATSLGAVDDPQAVGFALTGLAPQTTYYYRAEASNRYGTTAGVTRTFTTDQAPDADADGARLPADCNDGDRNVRPGAREIVGDGIDQDCSGADVRVVTAGIANQWALTHGRTRVIALTVTKLTAAARIELRCSGKGCPFKKKTRGVERATSRVALKSFFKRRSLRRGTRIEVRIAMTGFATKVVRYTTRAEKVPSVKRYCIPPGGARPVGCIGA